MDIKAFYGQIESMSASGEPERVIKFMRQSLAEAEAEKDRHAMVTILNELGGYYRNSSRYPEAVETMELALSEMRELGYEGTVHYGTTLLNAATAYRFNGCNEKALEQFTDALEIFLNNLPNNDHRLAAVFNNVSSIYEEAGQYSSALLNLQKALDILGNNPDFREQAAIVQTNLAMLLFKMDMEEEAIKELGNGLNLFRAGGKKPGPHYALALTGAAEAFMRHGKFDKAVDAYEEALEHIHSVFGKNRDFAITCNNCALAYERLGEKNLADDYRQFAESIFAKISQGGV